MRLKIMSDINTVSLSGLLSSDVATSEAKGIDVARREPRKTIRGEFYTSVGKFGPLLECIELTDKLIEQIVYKLYGLAEEEIAIVERQG
jgi:hypothetical protein